MLTKSLLEKSNNLNSFYLVGKQFSVNLRQSKLLWTNINTELRSFCIAKSVYVKAVWEYLFKYIYIYNVSIKYIILSSCSSGKVDFLEFP